MVIEIRKKYPLLLNVQVGKTAVLTIPLSVKASSLAGADVVVHTLYIK